MTVAEYWLRFGIDGWRLDVPAEIDDEAFWQEFRRRCRAIRPDAYLVGEIWRVAPDWLRGDRFDALMNYPLGEAILGFVGGSHLDMGIVTTHHEYRLWVRPLDGPTFADTVVELANAYDPDVVAVQLNVVGSHDAPRLRTVLGGDARRALLAMLLQATLPGAPSIFYGDEVGLVGGHDPDCRGAFPWDEGRWEPGLRNSVRALLHLRRAERGLRDGPLRVAGAAGSAVAFERGEGASQLRRGGQPGDDPVRLDIRLEGSVGGTGRLEPLDLVGLGGITAGPSRTAARRSSFRRTRVPSCASAEDRRGFRSYSAPVADLPIELGDGLAERLARILDVEAKIPRTFDALGPVGGRDVLLLDGAPGIRARQLTELGARVVFAATDDDARIDAPDGVGRRRGQHVAGVPRRPGRGVARGWTRPSTGWTAPRPPRLRPRRRLAASAATSPNTGS